VHADLPSPTVSEIRSLEVVPASRFPGYRPIAVVEIGRFQLGVNFRTPVSRKPSVRSDSNFGNLLPLPGRFVWHRSDVDPTVGFRVGEGDPKFSTSSNSGTDGDFVAPSSDFLSDGGPGRFCQVWRPSLDRKGFVRRVENFRFCLFAPSADDSCRPLDPFAASAVGGVDRAPSATQLLGWLSALRSLSPAVGPLAPIARCGGRASNYGLLTLFLRPEILNFCGRGAPPGPPPRRFDVGPLPRRPFAIPARGRRREPFRRRSAALSRPIFAFCGGPGNAFRPLGDVRGRSRRRRSIGRPRLSMCLPLTRNASGAPFSRYRARKATFPRIELLRTTGPDRLSHRSFGARHPGSL
jgi:hypothetical protein